MRLLLSLELRRAWNGLKRLGQSPVRLVVAVLVWGMALFGLAMQAITAVLFNTLDRGHLPPPPPDAFAKLEAAVFGLLLYLTWYLLDRAARDGLLAFSASDVDFLFPSPLPRRTVLGYKLLRDYLGLAAMTLFVGLFLSSQVSVLQGRLDRIVTTALPGLWCYLVLVTTAGHLLTVLVTFHGDRFRQAPLLLKLGFGGLTAALVAFATLARTGSGLGGWSHGLMEVVRSTAGRVLLLPLATAWEALVSPVAEPGGGFGLRLLLLAGLTVAAAVALLLRPENIYEPSVGASQFSTRLRQAMRGGDRRAVQALLAERRARQAGNSRLAPLGRAAGALLWRSFVGTFNQPLKSLLIYAFLAIGLPLLLVTLTRDQPHLLRIAPLFTLYIAFTGGMATFRQHQGELRQADLLKPLPLPGWQVILAQLLPTMVAWTSFLLLGLGVLRWISPVVEPLAFDSVMLSLPGVVAALALLNVCLALIFPSATDQAQNAAAGCGTMLCSLLLLLPGFVLGSVMVYAGRSGLAVGTACAAYFGLAALAELAVAHRLYRRFEPLDF